MGSTVRRKTAEISTVSQKIITPSGPSINIYVLLTFMFCLLLFMRNLFIFYVSCATHTQQYFLPHKAVLHALCPQKYINNFSIVPVSFILVLALGRKEKRCCFFIKSKLYFLMNTGNLDHPTHCCYTHVWLPSAGVLIPNLYAVYR